MGEEGAVTLEVNVMAAEDLKDVNLIRKMKPYVIVWFDDDPSRRSCTGVCSEGGKHPFWNQILKLPTSYKSLRRGTSLNIQIYSKRAVSSTASVIGSVQIPVARFSFLAGRDRCRDVEFFSEEVSRPSGKVQGTLHVAIRLESSTNKVQRPSRIIRANTGGALLRHRIQPRWSASSSIGEERDHPATGILDQPWQQTSVASTEDRLNPIKAAKRSCSSIGGIPYQYQFFSTTLG